MTTLELVAIYLSPFTVVGVVVTIRGLVALARLGSYPLPDRDDRRAPR